ncbi:hypothetical protein Deba_2052 [Desulfarculus baarsii DSM 2075]|uniref:Uncharacterized protein n=1 Tax=Desulfarculus baarsii (strain ATCC 33931 / DSM 2075 / LMG 7858 / VKM B-1802 / 2st14) TaxID=644282 RepID=E1QIA0_DESB2|nr:hypothetical protein [Desulfarculus baarsii]ADK85417.1 hypothetical protein Deba_2052 [Desulfarculus baarsii DSM 2075]
MASDAANKILQALGSGDGPFSGKEIAEITGLDSKQVSCQVGALKKKGFVESPVRCKYVITDAGKAELGN